MKHCCIIILLVLIGSGVALAGKGEKKDKREKPLEIDSAYIDPLTHRFQLKLFGTNNYNQLNVKNVDTKEYLNYNANTTPVFGAGIKIKGITIQGSFYKPFQEQDLANKGRSDYRDIQVYINGRKILYDISYQYFKGYYLSDSYSLFDTWNNTFASYRRPDLRIYAFNFNLLYNILSQKFSFKAAFSESERQIKSAGSPLCAFGVSYNKMKGDSSISPSFLSESFPADNGFLTSNSYNLHTGVGYAYTFVFWKTLFFTLAAIPQVNFQAVNYLHGVLGVQTEGRVAFLGQGRASLGINAKRLYLGVSLIYNTIPNGKLGNLNYNYNYGLIKASLIYRTAFRRKWARVTNG